jgi:pyruvate dehydrogenase E2 component (dihydrolipoamide acetyltransferase)
MEEGTILRWLKTDGDHVRRGDELVEIETDKATETYGADRDGVLEVVAAVGETLPVGAVIARLDGTAAAPPPEPPAAPAMPVLAAKGETTVVEAPRAHGVIARRAAESRATVPDFTVSAEVDVTALLDARSRLLGVGTPRASLDDLVVKACALALRDQPRLNASYRDGRFEQHSRVNVGLAFHDEGSLVVPTIFDADVKPLAAISRETRVLANKARAGTLTSPELAGATFTVSSLASRAVTRFAAVVNPPQAAILGVGGPVERPVVRDDEIVVRSVVELTLACDHRIVFPADAARFLERVRQLLESPAALLG